ncbi:MAG TPA: response regulator, partial [Pyrinomonadaceae bacterium]|nr:response regulator [Pyrinomonadaceae bacterium]
LKQDPELRKIPLVAVTAYAMVGDREKLLTEGFNGYLSKPINPETFVAEMTPYLRPKQAVVMDHFAQEKRPDVTAAEGTILVVDNSPVNISLAHSMLDPFGYTIVEARSVDEAMQILAEQSPDLILSDLHMPLKDGFDLIEAVKADDELRKIPFVFISSTVWGDREREHGLSLGAARFIIRPIEPQDLVAEIESCRSKGKLLANVMPSGNDNR